MYDIPCMLFPQANKVIPNMPSDSLITTPNTYNSCKIRYSDDNRLIHTHPPLLNSLSLHYRIMIIREGIGKKFLLLFTSFYYYYKIKNKRINTVRRECSSSISIGSMH